MPLLALYNYQKTTTPLPLYSNKKGYGEQGEPLAWPKLNLQCHYMRKELENC